MASQTATATTKKKPFLSAMFTKQGKISVVPIPISKVIKVTGKSSRRH